MPRRRTRRNPPLVTFANPAGRLRRVAVLSKRVYEVAYKHTDNGAPYRHKFGPGVCIELLADGSIRLYGMHGQPLWSDGYAEE